MTDTECSLRENSGRFAMTQSRLTQDEHRDTRTQGHLAPGCGDICMHSHRRRMKRTRNWWQGVGQPLWQKEEA